MSEDNFTKSFKYVENRLDSIEAKLDEKASQTSLDKLISTVDRFIAKIDHYETELLMRNRQFERLLE